MFYMVHGLGEEGDDVVIVQGVDYFLAFFRKFYQACVAQ